MTNTIARLLVGLGLLLLGRQLFWLFVGAIGFILGINLATEFFADQPDWFILMIALVVGVIGAVLAMLLQQVAVVVAGFVAGGIIAIDLLRLLDLQIDIAVWIPFIVGGIIGAILVGALFDWALIILSSLSGATLIVESWDFEPLVSLIILAVLIAVGLIVQGTRLRREGG